MNSHLISASQIKDRFLHVPLPLGVREVLEILNKNGYRALLVGGAVRDCLSNRSCSDFDIVTDGNPGEIFKLFKVAHIIGARFQIVVVMTVTGPVEVSTFRCHPEMSGENAIQQDSMLRDFTVNAIYYDPFAEILFDFFGGLDDLTKSVLRTIIDPNASFRIDPLRAVRGIRLAAKMNLVIDVNTYAALQNVRFTLDKNMTARIGGELHKMFKQGNVQTAFRLMCQTEIVKKIMPNVGSQMLNKNSENFIFSSFAFSDANSANVSWPTFFFIAALHWPLVDEKIKNYTEHFDYGDSLQLAISDVVSAQDDVIAHICRKDGGDWQSMLSIQGVFDRDDLNVAKSWIALPIRRLAYYLYCVRSNHPAI